MSYTRGEGPVLRPFCIWWCQEWGQEPEFPVTEKHRRAKRPALLLCKDQGFFLQSAFSSSHSDHISCIVLVFMLNEKEKTRWPKKAVIKIQRKWILKHKIFLTLWKTPENLLSDNGQQITKEKKIPRSLCIFEMTYGCEILRQRMRQSNLYAYLKDLELDRFTSMALG